MFYVFNIFLKVGNDGIVWNFGKGLSRASVTKETSASQLKADTLNE